MARTLIAMFQGLVLQVAWGEAVNFPALGQIMRGMIRNSILTHVGQASFDAALAKNLKETV